MSKNKKLATIGNKKFEYQPYNYNKYYKWFSIGLIFLITLSHGTKEDAVSFLALAVALFSIVYTVFSNIENNEIELVKSYIIRIETIEFINSYMYIKIKNIGSSHIVRGHISYLSIDGECIIENYPIAFLPIGEKVIIKVKIKNILQIKKINYELEIFNEVKLISFIYNQKMENNNNIYVIESNTCHLEKKIFYRWTL